MERSDRFRLLLVTNSLCLVWQCLLAVVALAHGPVALALALTALNSSTSSFEMPAVGATVPAMVPEPRRSAWPPCS